MRYIGFSININVQNRLTGPHNNRQHKNAYQWYFFRVFLPSALNSILTSFITVLIGGSENRKPLRLLNACLAHIPLRSAEFPI